MAVQYPAQVVLDRLETMITAPPIGLQGKMHGHHIVLDVTDERAHYWSPQVNFRVEPDKDHPEQCIVAGLIGPRPNVWTLFMFIYFSVGTIGFFIGSYGISLAMLGSYSNFLLAFPIAIFFMLSAFLTSKKGERLASDQTEDLKNFIRKAIA